jgi:hypothetical protein
LLLAAALFACGCKEYHGSVRDYETKKAIADATIVHAGQTVRSDKAGEFVLRRVDRAQPVLLKAPGYLCLKTNLPENGALRAELEPFEARGVYLSYNALGKPEVRARVMSWLGSKRLNTLVVDIKDERGRMTFYNGAPRAGQMGAFGAVKFEDIAAFIGDMHRQGVYVVGRMSVFKDSVLAEHNQAWTVKAKGRPNMFWLDPFRKEVWNYDLAIAKEAAGDGFDQIQFDNVRFPEAWEVPEASYSRRDSPGNRNSAIAGFWKEARRQLAPFNVCLSQGGPSAGSTSPPGDDASALPDYFAPQPGAGRGRTGPTGSAGGGARALRPYIPCGSAIADHNLQAAVAACRTAGASGWVLCDASGNYDVPRDLIGALGAKDE